MLWNKWNKTFCWESNFNLISSDFGIIVGNKDTINYISKSGSNSTFRENSNTFKFHTYHKYCPNENLMLIKIQNYLVNQVQD